MRRTFFLFSFFLFAHVGIAQTWVDSVETFSMQPYLPASKYVWSWQHAAFLNTMVKRYDQVDSLEKHMYFDYIETAMNRTKARANGKTPNGVASGLGMAFLYEKTGDEFYKAKCDRIYEQYLQVRRTPEGAVSHLPTTLELWDDTVFMIGQFMLAMYRATGDEKYLNEFALQLRLHREKLLDTKWGMWYHGWDANDKDGLPYFCGQMGWPDDSTRVSGEIWGRGNGWIHVTLSDALEVIPRENPMWEETAGYLREMLEHLPELQDEKTGHWYQLPVRKDDPENWIESSCTAMFAYGMITALKLGIVDDRKFVRSTELAYNGLRQHSLEPRGDGLICTNVCTGTCIGDKDYYLKRGVQKGRSFGLAMFIQFGMRYEIENGLR
ncbi:MAG: Unsaturated rhamnogalacturonyl hydrolase [Bacteroidota bacterium]